MPEPAEILADPLWLAHRYDESRDGFRFVRVDRDMHRSATFITDEHITGTEQFEFIARDATDHTALSKGPVKFVFHSAYCCSTMIARAFDIEGKSMGLKEPQLLNDLLGWQRRGASGPKFQQVLDCAIALLGRPFADGEAIVIKPSNIVSPLAERLLDQNENAQALFLHAPIDSYLRSIAKKGLWGRRWVREVLLGTIKDGCLIGGFEDQELLELTDLQVAALGWLSQHALFDRLAKRFGPQRIRTLDSQILLASQKDAMGKLFAHFDIELSAAALQDVLSGPAFNTHSKDSSEQFDAGARAIEQAKLAESYGEEVSMVSNWTQAVAQSQGFDLALSNKL